MKDSTDSAPPPTAPPAPQHPGRSLGRSPDGSPGRSPARASEPGAAGRHRIDGHPRLLVAVVLALGLAGACGIVGAVGPADASTKSNPSAADPPTAASGPSAGSSRAEPAERWTWPIPPPHDVVRGFEAPTAQWSPGHRGVDIGATPGTVVVAPESGVVHFAGVVVDRPVLSLEHAGGLLSSFEPVTATVARGDPVQRGQPIGVVLGGHGDGPPSLHVGARVDGVYVSPLLFLGGAVPAVLLPTRR